LRDTVHLNLDDAWRIDSLGLREIDAREEGPRLRFSAPRQVIEHFYNEVSPRVAPFVVYGSGDFHHLSALWLRRLSAPTVVVSFDNHPDWDVRPPKWCCGSWVNRALELPHVRKVSVWGCGNFECWWPAQLFGNRRAERRGNLEVHPWADDRSAADQQRRGAILQSDWRERFLAFVRALDRADVYVTIDIDCLRASEAVTNWENGRFAVDDVIWALEQIRAQTEIVGGDICGAFSPPSYARRKQRFASEMDHPKLSRASADETQRINQDTLARLLPALTQ
jgi:arginase family enzyme